MERAHRAMGDLAMREHDRESNRTERRRSLKSSFDVLWMKRGANVSASYISRLLL